jgi:IS1 family transposase
MNKLAAEKRTAIVAALVEGNSLRATCRMTGASRNTVLKLLSDMGVVCSVFQDRVMRDLPCERIQVDEIWSFCYAKQKNVPDEKRGQFGYGDIWTWVAIDADTKLVPTFHIGPRDVTAAKTFMRDLAKRLRDRVQLTTDGHPAYVWAVRDAFEGDVDYAQLIKQYGPDPDPEAQRRYSPAACIGIDVRKVNGNPDPDSISTSFIERQNLTMRMSLRRFTRLTNAFSKKIENHAAAISLHFAYYNFCRVHQTLKTTPAVAAGIADHVWKLDELVALLDDAERAVPRKRGPYKKREISK